MGDQKSVSAFALWISVLALLPGLLFSQEQPRLQEDVLVRWWLVPLYALNKDGSAARDLKPEDFEVYVNQKRVESFDLHRKDFRVLETPPGKTEAGVSLSFEKKIILLVFDSAFSTYNLLEKAKKVSATLMSREVDAAQFLALSIEPYAGLKPIVGPTRDRGLVSRSIEKFVAGKKVEYLRASALDSTAIRRVYPKDSQFADRNPDESRLPGRSIGYFDRIDTLDKRRVASVYTRSLMTLSLILGYFKDNSKIIYLFSCGIPAGALEWKNETIMDPTLSPEPGVTSYFNISPDQLNLQALVNVGRHFNRNGSLLFLINPSGTRLDLHDQDSGEQSLRILAEETGGRYFDGPEQEIAREIASMESGYYEISFPDSAEFQGPDMDFILRPKNPDLRIYTVKTVSRGKEYSQLTGLEKEVLVLNLLDRGPYAQTGLNVIEADYRVEKKGGLLTYLVRLPSELDRSEWEIFKVWRNTTDGKISLERQSLFSPSTDFAVGMKERKSHRSELVLVHPRTGNALVIRSR